MSLIDLDPYILKSVRESGSVPKHRNGIWGNRIVIKITKNPELYMIIVGKYFPRFFFFGGGVTRALPAPRVQLDIYVKSGRESRR